MQVLYNFFILLVSSFIPILALFNPKLRLFYKGRKETFSKLQNSIQASDNTVWIHCASLGEFEQGRPLIEKIKLNYPNFKIVLSFFSPSGYEIRKDYDQAAVVVYLPIDTPKKVAKFLEVVHPSLAIFIKYEFWPNILLELQQRNIPVILVSGIFRKNQLFFKKSGTWYRNTLQSFKHFFVQDEGSLSLLRSIGFTNATVSGDTRFDRVFDIIEQRKELVLIEKFTKNQYSLVAGSTWPKDEALLVNYINNHASDEEKFIIAPHNINSLEIDKLIKELNKKTLLYSNANSENIADAEVLIIDSIGLLTSVYYYGNIAYVGGGFGTGIHNILEPATFGMPIVIGPNYQKFNEALELVERDACFEINGEADLANLLQSFYKDAKKLKEAGKKAATYVKNNTGATDIILRYLSDVLR